MGFFLEESRDLGYVGGHGGLPGKETDLTLEPSYGDQWMAGHLVGIARLKDGV